MIGRDGKVVVVKHHNVRRVHMMRLKGTVGEESEEENEEDGGVGDDKTDE